MGPKMLAITRQSYLDTLGHEAPKQTTKDLILEEQRRALAEGKSNRSGNITVSKGGPGLGKIDEESDYSN